MSLMGGSAGAHGRAARPSEPLWTPLASCRGLTVPTSGTDHARVSHRQAVRHRDPGRLELGLHLRSLDLESLDRLLRLAPGWPSIEPFAVALVASLLFFGCILLHELAHSLVPGATTFASAASRCFSLAAYRTSSTSRPRRGRSSSSPSPGPSRAFSSEAPSSPSRVSPRPCR